MKRGDGIKLLQGAVSQAKTSDLMDAYRAIESKSVFERTNEEKMVRATAIDELANRGALIYDPKTEDYVVNESKDRVVFIPDIGTGRSYRIIEIRHAESYVGTGKPADYAKAEFYFGGKWNEVKNSDLSKRIAEAYKAEQRRRKK